MRIGSLILLCVLTGCASPQKRTAEAEARGYERGYAQAIKEQYWIIQNRQRPAATNPNPGKP